MSDAVMAQRRSRPGLERPFAQERVDDEAGPGAALVLGDLP
jgi:hypothetical protein